MITLGCTAPCAPTSRFPRCAVSDASREFIELLSVAVRLVGLRSALAEVVALAGDAPGLSDEQLRAALVGVARRLGGETR
jgi:hypothetical protein